MPTRKPKDKLSKSDKRMLKRMDKDIKTYALKGKTKKTRRKRIVKKVSPTTGNIVKVKLKRGGGIKKTVTRKAGTVRNMRLKRRVVKKKRDTRPTKLNAMRNARDKRRAKKNAKKK
mgnify:CR=1 FL=1